MDTKKLTESAMLSALFIVASIFFLSSAIGYSIFLSFGVPIIITLIYLRCDAKYTLMSSITSLLLITFIFGNPAIGIWMVQGMAIGFICGFLILKHTRLTDDLLYCSMFSAVVLIFVDVFFSGILGESFISEAKEALVYIPLDETLLEVCFYILIAALPLGTIIMTYIGSLFLGEKLKLLNENGRIKYVFVRKYKRFGSLQYLSDKITYAGIIYVAFIKLIGKNNILFRSTYLKTILITAEYITIYFLIKDAYTIICGFIYKISHSRLVLAAGQAALLYSIVCYFSVAAIVMMIFSLLIDKKFSIKRNTDIILNNINLKAELC